MGPLRPWTTTSCGLVFSASSALAPKLRFPPDREAQFGRPALRRSHRQGVQSMQSHFRGLSRNAAYDSLKPGKRQCCLLDRRPALLHLGLA